MKPLATRTIVSNSFNTMPGPTPEQVVASGEVAAQPHVSLSTLMICRDPGSTCQNQDTLGPSLAHDCKCAFGAKSITIYV